MKKIGICLTSLLLLLTLDSCRKDDLDPPTDLSPDTVAVSTPDFRAPYTGLFDVTMIYKEFGYDTVSHFYTDSVKIAYENSILIPISVGSFELMTIYEGGSLESDHTHGGPPWPDAWSGSFSSVDEFSILVTMDVQPHTWWRTYHGVRH